MILNLFSCPQKCSDYKASTVSTFARTEPPDTQVTKSIIALLLHYNWNKFSIIAERPWSTVAKSLQDQAPKSNLSINHFLSVEDRHICCEDRLPCCQGGGWFSIVQDTKNMTRSLHFYTVTIFLNNVFLIKVFLFSVYLLQYTYFWVHLFRLLSS